MMKITMSVDIRQTRLKNLRNRSEFIMRQVEVSDDGGEALHDMLNEWLDKYVKPESSESEA